jgi:hypothetical protein
MKLLFKNSEMTDDFNIKMYAFFLFFVGWLDRQWQWQWQ